MSNVLKEKEFGENSVVKDFLTTAVVMADGTELRQSESRVKGREREV